MKRVGFSIAGLRAWRARSSAVETGAQHCLFHGELGCGPRFARMDYAHRSVCFRSAIASGPVARSNARLGAARSWARVVRAASGQAAECVARPVARPDLVPRE